MLPVSSAERRSRKRPPLWRHKPIPRPWKAALRRLAFAAAALAAAVVLAPAAMADESAMPTTQATAYNADWVPYLDPPAKPAAVCLVDSGVNITPDTPPDSPEGPIVKRLALDGGSGLAANSTWEGLHGTRMAFVGAAPANGWGAVGFWPGARIISIRAMPAGETTFPFDNYSSALALCTKQREALNIVVVNLSLSCDCVPTGAEKTRLDTQLAKAHDNGEGVVAAAGNTGGPVGSPANQPSVLSVAATDKGRQFCAFSARGEFVDLAAPGCDIDLADPTSGQLWTSYRSGTSGASITTAVVIAGLRSYRPDLGWRAAEELVTSATRRSAEAASLDVEAVFRAAGLGDLVDSARARATAALIAPPEGIAGSSSQHEGAIGVVGGTAPNSVSPHVGSDRVLPIPRLKALVRADDRLAVVVSNRPADARLIVSLQRRRSEFGYSTVTRIARRRAVVTFRMPHKWRSGRVVLAYALARKPRVSSRPLYRRVPR